MTNSEAFPLEERLWSLAAAIVVSSTKSLDICMCILGPTKDLTPGEMNALGGTLCQVVSLGMSWGLQRW